MPSTKRPASARRVKLPRSSDVTKQFLKDWDRYADAGRRDLRPLKDVMLLIIADDVALPPEWKDHELKGPWSGHRECHVGGDFLLIYKATVQAVVFVRCGTHAELFE